MAAETQPMDPQRLAELRRLAGAATPGPWEWDANSNLWGDAREVLVLQSGPDHADAAFIEAANPATILALLDEVARQAARADAAEAKVVSVGAEALGRVMELRDEVARLRAPLVEPESLDGIDVAVYIRRQWAEIRRLRARVRVEAIDVEQAGVTRAHVEAWLQANGWSRTDCRTRSASAWRNAALRRTVFLHDDPGLLLAAIPARGKSDLWRVLDEMAAMPVEPKP